MEDLTMTNGNQPPDSTPTLATQIAELGDQLNLLKAQQDLANAQLTARIDQENAVASAQKSLLETLFPAGEVKPLEGKIETADTWGVAAEIVAYQVTKNLEDDFVARLEEGVLKGKKVLLVDNLQYALDSIPRVETKMYFDLFESTFGEQTNHIKDLLKSKDVDEKTERSKQIKRLLETNDSEKALPEAPVRAEMFPAIPLALAATVAVPSVISTLASAAGYFQTDYSIKGREFSVKLEALQAAVAGKLREQQAEVFISNFYAIENSPLLQRFVNLLKAQLGLKMCRDQLDSQRVKPLTEQIDKLTQEIRELESTKQRLLATSGASQQEIDRVTQDLTQKKAELSAVQTLANTANAAIQAADVTLLAWEGLTKAITSPTDGQPPKLVRAILREKVETLGVNYILCLGSVSSGGDAIARRNLWSSGKTSFLGGTAITFVMAETDGKIIAADTLVGLGVLDHQFDWGRKGSVRKIPVSE
jgi:hypothetical protein